MIAWTIQGYEQQAQHALRDTALSTAEYATFLADFDAYLALLHAWLYR